MKRGRLAKVGPARKSRASSLATVDLKTGRLDGSDLDHPWARLVGGCLIGRPGTQSALFSGIPITDRLPVEERKCGVWVVDTRSGQIVAFLRFEAGVQEIFAVQVLPGLKYPDVLTEDQQAVASSFMLPDEALADVPKIPAAG